MCKKGPPAVWTKEKIEEAFAGYHYRKFCIKVLLCIGVGPYFFKASIWAADTQNI